jgi:ligand-binding SRPBCC domain-containing protein
MLPTPIDEVWRFFEDARNLVALSPADAGLSLDPELPAMAEGVRFTHQMQLMGPVTLPWEGEIVAWEPGRRFVDIQRKGPFGSWWHAHSFEPVELEDGTPATAVHDQVFFASPLGPIGRLATALFVRSQLMALFAFRNGALRLRFGDVAPSTPTPHGATA